MRFRIPNNTKCYGGVSDTNTNSTKYTLETPNNPKYKFFWLFGAPNCHALVLIMALLAFICHKGNKMQKVNFKQKVFKQVTILPYL